MATELCLLLDGSSLSAGDLACTLTLIALPAGELDEAAFADWIGRHSASVKR